MEDLVSVVIPSYNHEKYIKECVLSVLNQTYKNLEVFVMDDNSTDDSAKILKRIKDSRLKVFCSKKNQGTVRTVNKLMNMCKGEYIAVIGSDDVWMEDKIEKQVNYLKSNKNIGAVFSDAEIIDENNNLYKDDDSFDHDVFNCDNVSSGERMRIFFEKGNHLCHSSSLIRSDVVKEIGLYNVVYRQLHDFDYWVRLINNFNIYILGEKLVKYRRFKNSKKNLSNNSCESMIRVVNENNEIIRWMFDNINDDVFIDGFKDLFVNNNSHSFEELFCEKYFILLNYTFMGVVNKQLAFSFLFRCTNQDRIFELLEKKFNYSLVDFYNDTGETYDVFNYNIVNDYKSSNGEAIHSRDDIIEKQTNIINMYNDKIDNLEYNISVLKNSISWKITKPVRWIRGLIKNEKS